MRNCNGTHTSFSISGCLPFFIVIRRSVLIFGAQASQSILSFPLEKIKSNFSNSLISFSKLSEASAIIAERVYKIRRSSFSASRRSSCNSEKYLPTADGSINNVLPEEDLSITLPLTFNLYSFLTGTQICPLRIVLKLSDIYCLLFRIIRSAFSRILSSVRTIALRRSFKSDVALSSTLPSRI